MRNAPQKTLDEEKLIKLVISYTRRERRDVDVGSPKMVKTWLDICRLAGAIRKSRNTPGLVWFDPEFGYKWKLRPEKRR